MTDREARKTSAEVEFDDDDLGVTGRERVVRTIGLALLLLILTIAAYQAAWHAGYIWDDDVYVTANKLLTAPDGLKRIWFSLDAPSQYFPLVYTSFRIEHALWGLNPTGYHWVNLALHAVNALLLWRLLRVLAVPGAWLAAALFALHPVQVESVAWISERKNVLMGLFFLLTLLAWQRFVAGARRGDLRFYFLALVCCALALASKTTACTLPVVLLLMSWYKRGAISLARAAQVLPFAILSVGMGLVTIWWERFHQGTQGQLFAIGPIERVLVAARGFWFYLVKLVWPAHLAFSYPRWNISASDPADYLWLGAFVLLALAIWLTRRWIGRGPETAFAFFAVMLAPTLGFVMLYTFRYSFVADHYQYLACIGPFALVAAAISVGLDRLPRVKPIMLPIICAALLLPLGWRTWRQAAIYTNEETLWRATLVANPSSWMAHNNLAILLLHRDLVNEAIDHFKEALRLDPNYAEAHYNYANALLQLGLTEEAREHYERALQMNGQIAVAHANLGALLEQRGLTSEAISHYEEAVKIDPNATGARQRLGQLLVREGKTEEGVAQLKEAVASNPDTIAAHNELTLALLREGKPAEARAHAERVAEANPQNSAAQVNLGIILGELGEDEQAIAHYQRALELDPQNSGAHYNLANTFLKRREREEAMAEYRKALEIKPDYAGARLNLANALVETGQLNEAVAEYEKVLEVRPDYAPAHANIAAALNNLGRFDEAFEHLQVAWRLEAEARSKSPAPRP